VQVAGDAAAVLAGHPQVGASGIQHDLELLRWGADGDFTEVLSVEEVAHGDWVTGFGFDGSLAEHLLETGLGPNAHVLLTEVLHLLVDVDTLLARYVSVMRRG
jgi:hypothetical protein